MEKRYRGNYPASKADRQNIESKKKRDQETTRLIEAYKAIFSGIANQEDATIVYDDLMEFCLVGRMTMTGNSWTYFNEGKRAVGERIREMINTHISIGG